MVTERAMGVDQGQRYLLVVNAEDVAEYRPVEIGVLDDGLRVITAGISADDRVVVNGIQRVRPGVKVKASEVAMPVRPAAAAPSAGTTSAPAAGGSDSGSNHGSAGPQREG
jgi:multidrug efflux system membrane fusion protein